MTPILVLSIWLFLFASGDFGSGEMNVVENNIISLETLWKIWKDHMLSYVGSVLKSKMIKSSAIKSDAEKLKELYKSLTGWIMPYTACTTEFL